MQQSGDGVSYALKNFDLATLDWLLQSDRVNPIATGANKFLIARGDMKGVTGTTDLISVWSGTPAFPTSQPGSGHQRNAQSNEALQALRGIGQ